MRMSVAGAVLFLFFSFAFAGCQTTAVYSQTGSIAPGETVAISQGQQTGTWRGKDLSVDFKSSWTGSGMDLAGTVNFADHMTLGYSILHDFRLSAIFVDKAGRVLATNGLTTQRGDFSPIPFRTRLTVPANTAGIAFSYQGTAIESGGGEDGGGATYFWQ